MLSASPGNQQPMSQVSEDADMENGVAEAGAEPGADATPKTPTQKAARSSDVSVIVEGVFALLRTTLGEILKPELLEAVLKKAQKDPAVKAMMHKVSSMVIGSAVAHSSSLARSRVMERCISLED